MGMGMHQAQRLEQRLEMRQMLAPAELGVAPFRTEGEELQISEYDILKKLLSLIDKGEFFDPTHFTLETNRAIFTNPLQARLGKLAGNLTSLMKLYDGDEVLAKRILVALGTQKEADKKDTPGRIADAWATVTQHALFRREQEQHYLLKFVEHLSKQEADIASGVGVVAQASAVEKQPALVKTALEEVTRYATQDKRLVPFAQRILAPVFRALKGSKSLSVNEAKRLYENIIDNLFMLDRTLNIPGGIEKVAEAIRAYGVQRVLESTLPLPLQVMADSVVTEQATRNAFMQLPGMKTLADEREVQRRVYTGLALIETLPEQERILAHIIGNAKDVKGFGRITAALEQVYKDPEFTYPFQVTEEQEIVRHLRTHLVDKSIRRLKFDPDTLETYIQRIEKDERFSKISNIITTLAGYKHYQDDHRLNLLREIATAELAGKFQEWKYSHDLADIQLQPIGGVEDEQAVAAWKERSRVTRIVGELNALDAHIQAVKKTTQKLQETYKGYYNQECTVESLVELERSIVTNETQLREEGLSKAARKELGYQTSKLREQVDYAKLVLVATDLDQEKYAEFLEHAETLARKRTNHPLYDAAVWVRETLDQPAYRNARKIQIYSTDDLEELLRFGETPVPHCQSWKHQRGDGFNDSLLSFVADANKEMYVITNGDGKAIATPMTRLIEHNDGPAIVVDDFDATEWSDDYGIAFLGSLAEKAAALYKATGKPVSVGSNDPNLRAAFEHFGRKYGVEVFEDQVDILTAPSKSPTEYFNCGPGHVNSGAHVRFGFTYVTIGDK